MNAQTAHDMVCVKSTSIVKARLVKKEIYKVMTEQVCWFQVLVWGLQKHLCQLFLSHYKQDFYKTF